MSSVTLDGEDASVRANGVDLLRCESLFSELSEDALRMLADQLRLQHFAAGATMIREGDASDHWYLMRDGMAAVVRRDLIGREVTLATLGPGQSFGERALLTQEPRAATVRAATPVSAYVLGRHAVQYLAAANPAFASRVRHRVDLLEIDTYLKRASPFAQLSPETLWRLVAHFRPRRVLSGDVIISEGDAADDLYLVRSGRAEVHRGRRRVTVLEAGDVFGEVALVTGSRRTASVRALDDTELLCLAMPEFQSVIQEQPSLGSYFRELVRIRYHAASARSKLLPEPVPPLMPFLAAIAARRVRRYWLVLLVGALVFALLTVVATVHPDHAAEYAALGVGSFVGPVVFVLYLVESDILDQRLMALALTAALAAGLGLPAAIALQRQTGVMPDSLGAGFLIAAIEEPAKVLGVLWVIHRSSLRFKIDGVLYGAAAGMGFAACETILYGLTRVDVVGALLATLWLRALLSPFTHGTWTALACAALWREPGSGRLRRLFTVVLGCGGAIVLHALWNWQPLPFPWGYAWLLVVGTTSVLALKHVVQRALLQEASAVLALNPTLASQEVAADRALRCRGCRQMCPPGTRYCPRCSLALSGGPA